MRKHQKTLSAILFLWGFVLLWGCGNEDAGETQFSASLEVVGSFDGLSGKLIFIEQRSQPNFRVAQLDLSSGKIDTLFQIPQNGWIYEVAMNRQGELLFSYSPPTSAGEPQLDGSGLYSINPNSSNSQPQVVLEAQEAGEFNASPVWGSNEQTLYISQLKQDPFAADRQISTLLEYDLSLGSITQMLPSAMTPSFTSQESLMTYIHVNPVNQVRSIYVAASGWTSEQVVVDEFEFYDISNPIFAPDANSIYFVALENPLETLDQSWLEELLSGTPVYAHADHNLPADWWRVNFEDGSFEQITNQSLIIHDGIFSPDGAHFAFSSQEGLHIMQTDGTELQLLIKSRAIRDIYWVE